MKTAIKIGNTVKLEGDTTTAEVLTVSKTKASVKFKEHPIYGNAIREYSKKELFIVSTTDEQIQKLAEQANGYLLFSKDTKAPVFNEGFIEGYKLAVKQLKTK